MNGRNDNSFKLWNIPSIDKKIINWERKRNQRESQKNISLDSHSITKKDFIHFSCRQTLMYLEWKIWIFTGDFYELHTNTLYGSLEEPKNYSPKSNFFKQNCKLFSIVGFNSFFLTVQMP